MTTNPKISVVMPFYNCEKFLDESISSILNQTFTDFEFIIINDASTDNSDFAVQRYLSDGRIRYIKNEKNVGIVKNLNKGLEVSRADVIARMDGDDLSVPTRLEKQYQFLAMNPAIDMVGTFIKIIDEGGEETGRVVTKPTQTDLIERDLFKFLTCIHATAMIRRSLYSAIGKYRDEYLYCEDADFTYRTIYSGHKVANLSEFLYLYRYHAASTAHNSRSKAWLAFRLKREIVRVFRLKLTAYEYIMTFLQLAVGLAFSGRQRQWIESIYKRFFYEAK